MEKKKSDKLDYALPSQPKKLTNPFTLKKQSETTGQNINQSMFMRYASSIIQVVTEEKLQPSVKNGFQVEPKSPIYQISEVNYYQGDPSMKNSTHLHNQQNNYNIFGQPFKKKSPNKRILVYNFSNFTILINSASVIMKKLLKQTFSIIKNTRSKIKTTSVNTPKARSSFHSDYTSSTSNQDLGTKKTIRMQQKIKRNEQMREGADQIKGWMEFRILIIKKVCFRQLLQYQRRKKSPILVGQKKDHLIQNFCLSAFNNDHSLSLDKDLHHNSEESLVYTADQNFQFSQKEMTITTPEKFSIQQRLNTPYNESRAQRYNNSANGSHGNTHESMVQVYKHHRKNSLKPSRVQDANLKQISIADPIQLKVTEERRYLTVRTNTYQLPLITQFYFRDELIGKGKDLSLKSDYMVKAQPQSSCDMVDSILRDIQSVQFVKQQHIQNSSLKKSGSINSYQTFINQKKAKLSAEFGRNSGQEVSQTYKPIAFYSQKNVGIAEVGKNNNGLTATQERKGPHKIQNYYFPGRQSRETLKEGFQQCVGIQIQSKIRKSIKQVKNAESILGLYQRSGQKSGKPLRIEQSMVSNFNVTEQPTTKEVRGTAFPIKREKGQYIVEAKIMQQRKVNKINIALQSPNRKMQPSPSQIQINGIGNNNCTKKPQPLRSPPASNRYKSPYDNPQPIERPVNQQYNSHKNIEKIVRVGSKDNIIQSHNYQNNVYQINNPTTHPIVSPPKQYFSNANTYNREPIVQHQQIIFTDNKVPPQVQQHQYPHHQAFQPQVVLNRPASRLASPSNYAQPHPEPQNYGLQKSRQNSQKKISFYSPEAPNTSNFVQKPVRFNNEVRPQPQNNNRAQLGQQYFMMQPQNSNMLGKAINFNNKYYTSGAQPKPIPLVIQPNQPIIPLKLIEQNKPRKSFGSERPHTSFRQSTQRANVFSNYSPMESELEYQQRSNHLSSRNSSQLSRPKSMNEKIHITMRRQR